MSDNRITVYQCPHCWLYKTTSLNSYWVKLENLPAEIQDMIVRKQIDRIVILPKSCSSTKNTG